MSTDAYCCPNCGYFEKERPPRTVPDRTRCPRCSADSARLLTPPIVARVNPMVHARVQDMPLTHAAAGQLVRQ